MQLKLTDMRSPAITCHVDLSQCGKPRWKITI